MCSSRGRRTKASCSKANPNYRGGAAKLKRVVIRHMPEASAQRLAARKGRRRHRRQPDAGPDHRPRRQQGRQDHRRPAGPALLHRPQPEDQGTARTRRSARRCATSSTTTAWRIRSSRAPTQVHQSFWATGFWASYDENPYKLDVAKAKELLKEAGYPDGFSLDLDAPNFAPFTNMAQSVQSTFAQGGVKVNIVSAETKPMLTKYRARQHQVLMVYWGPDYMDPHTNADGFITQHRQRRRCPGPSAGLAQCLACRGRNQADRCRG